MLSIDNAGSLLRPVFADWAMQSQSNISNAKHIFEQMIRHARYGVSFRIEIEPVSS